MYGKPLVRARSPKKSPGPTEITVWPFSNRLIRPAQNHVKRKRRVACVEQSVPSFQVDIGHDLGLLGTHQIEVAAEEEIECPVQHHSQFAFEAGQLEEIDRPP